MMKPLHNFPTRAVTDQDFEVGDAKQSSAPHLPQAGLEMTLGLPIVQRVFVVDDDPLVRASLCAILTEWPVEAFADATSFLRDGYPHCGDCVIADLQMPQMNGVELQHALNTRGVTLPVIILSGQADVPLAVEAMKAGAFEFIQKPFDASTLQVSVTRARKHLILAAEVAKRDGLNANETPI